MSTATERLRLDLGLAADDTTTLPDLEATDIFSEAGETYTDAASIKASSRVIALYRLMAQAATVTNYTQNASREESGTIFANYARLLALWQGHLADAVISANGGAARFGSMRQKPARVKEYPNA